MRCTGLDRGEAECAATAALVRVHHDTHVADSGALRDAKGAPVHFSGPKELACCARMSGEGDDNSERAPRESSLRIACLGQAFARCAGIAKAASERFAGLILQRVDNGKQGDIYQSAVQYAKRRLSLVQDASRFYLGVHYLTAYHWKGEPAFVPLSRTSVSGLARVASVLRAVRPCAPIRVIWRCVSCSGGKRPQCAKHALAGTWPSNYRLTLLHIFFDPLSPKAPIAIRVGKNAFTFVQNPHSLC